MRRTGPESLGYAVVGALGEQCEVRSETEQALSPRPIP